MVVGSEEPEEVLFQILRRLGLSLDVCTSTVDFIQRQGSLLATGNASPTLCSFLRALNEETWFVVDGSETVSRSHKGARPGETIADLIFTFLFGKVTEEVRAAIDESEYCVSLPYNAASFVDHCREADANTTELESTYADDIMHCLASFS